MVARGTAWLLLPAVAALLLLIGYPIVETVRLSFTSASLAGDPGDFVGLQNYSDALASPAFWQSLRTTVLFTGLTVSTEMVFGLLVALLLDMPLYGRTVLRAVLIIPWALPTVINAITWRMIYNPEFGALNALLQQGGLIAQYRSWLGDPATAIYAIAAADFWKTFPFVALVMSAALQGVPQELHEAARVDGAGVFARFRTVTVPAILVPFSIVAVLRLIETIKVFDIIYVMTRGGPLNATRSLSILVYQQAFSFGNNGYGAALALLTVLLSLLLIAVYMAWFRKQAVA
jgi:multiple sugar transport system permease protein